MSQIATREHKQISGKLKNVLATYNESEDLINIGAYKRGSNKSIDYAIDKIDAVNAFLMQDVDAKFDFDEFTSTEGVKNAKIPLVFIHGTDDGFVPVEHTYENIKACTVEHTDIIVEGADHGLSYFTDPEAVTSGLESVLKKVFDDFE
jgi:pimeloyl-ACP methyl ester carboxylesterase